MQSALSASCFQFVLALVQNQEYISEYGSLLAEVKRADEATQVLQLAVQRFPEEGFEKYM